jgi:hypothetical protein
MGGWFKEYIWPIILIVLEIVLRAFPIEKLEFLRRPRVCLNLIEVLILVCLVFWLKGFLPVTYKKRRNRTRARRLQINWQKFKAILEQYIRENIDSQNQYKILRDQIREDINYFLADINDVLKNISGDEQNSILYQFQQCFEPIELKEWYAKVRRQVPSDLDCFDYIPAALVRHFDK